MMNHQEDKHRDSYGGSLHRNLSLRTSPSPDKPSLFEGMSRFPQNALTVRVDKADVGEAHTA